MKINKMAKIVKNMKTLHAMRRRNLIRFCDETGFQVLTLYSDKKMTCYYIDKAVDKNPFEYNGEKYQVKFFDGCFYPFVVKLGVQNDNNQKEICLAL